MIEKLNFFIKIKLYFVSLKTLFFSIKSQFFFKLYRLLKNFISNNKSNYLKQLEKDGYVIVKNVFSNNELMPVYNKYKNKLDEKRLKLKEYSASYSLDILDEKIWINKLFKKNLIDVCYEYLGRKLITFSNDINHLYDDVCHESSMQPHHDARNHDLKIYIWISKYSTKCHPLFYLKGSHRKMKFWLTYRHTRNKKIPREKMDKIYGNTGDVIIFDTLGWHSHFKDKTEDRTVLDFCIAPNNFLFGSPKNGKILDQKSRTLLD